MRMWLKQYFRRQITRILVRQAHRLQNKWRLKIVGVVGSVGKTTTKHVIAQYLNDFARVRYQHGNYNDIISVPLVFFNRKMPRLYNPFAWLVLFVQNELTLLRSPEVDVIVLELGTDSPGQIKQFETFLHLDVAVVTAVGAEHMENFKNIDAVAEEELSVSEFTNVLIINSDDVPQQYFSDIKDVVTYGINEKATVQIVQDKKHVLLKHDGHTITLTPLLLGIHVQKALAAAYLVGHILDIMPYRSDDVLSSIPPMPGRMQQLKGIKDTIIIDDTYNASPDSVIAALRVLYDSSASTKIAVLGNMNEMGDYSKNAHEQVANFLEKKQLKEVLLLGAEVVRYIEPIAKKKGIPVTVFKSPYEVGAYLRKHVQPGAIVLLKGSQNGVFLEEAIRPILKNSSDSYRLVRQSSDWLKKKKVQFPKNTEDE